MATAHPTEEVSKRKHGASDWEVEEGIAGLLGWPNATQIVRAHTDCLPGVGGQRLGISPGGVPTYHSFTERAGKGPLCFDPLPGNPYHGEIRSLCLAVKQAPAPIYSLPLTSGQGAGSPALSPASTGLNISRSETPCGQSPNRRGIVQTDF